MVSYPDLLMLVVEACVLGICNADMQRFQQRLLAGAELNIESFDNAIKNIFLATKAL